MVERCGKYVEASTNEWKEKKNVHKKWGNFTVRYFIRMLHVHCTMYYDIHERDESALAQTQGYKLR